MSKRNPIETGETFCFRRNEVIFGSEKIKLMWPTGEKVAIERQTDRKSVWNWTKLNWTELNYFACFLYIRIADKGRFPSSCVVFLACVHLALFLALFLSPGNSLVSSWYDHSRPMLASLLWQCPTVPSLREDRVFCEPFSIFDISSFETLDWLIFS